MANDLLGYPFYQVSYEQIEPLRHHPDAFIWQDPYAAERQYKMNKAMLFLGAAALAYYALSNF